MKNIRIKFCDFYDGFDYQEFFLFKLLSEKYQVDVVHDNPEYVFYSAFGKSFSEHKNAVLFFVGVEHYFPNILYADYTITATPVKNKSGNDAFNRSHFRISNFIHYPHMKSFIEKQSLAKDLLPFFSTEKTEFCNFIYGNKNARVRKSFFKKLSQYKTVDSLGRTWKNKKIEDIVDIPNGIHWKEEKLYMLMKYRFTIAMENGLRPYSFSEKVIQALQVGSIPIYWGDNSIYDYVNPNAIIDIRKYNTIDEVIEYIKFLEENPDVLQEIRDEPAFLEGSEILNQGDDKILEWLVTSINNPIKDKTVGFKIKVYALTFFRFMYKIYWKIVSIKRRFWR